MRPARGHRAFSAQSHRHSHRRLKTCQNLILTICLLTLAAVWTFSLTQTTSSGLLPHSLNNLEILWETRTLGEDLCHARLRHSGILLDKDRTNTTTASRHRLYTAMNASLSQGLQLGGGAVQGKDVDEFFTKDATTGTLKPILHPLSTPVRAVVLPLLDLSLAQSLKKALTQHLVPLFPPDTVWLQNSELLHSTVYHASTHMDPVPSTQQQIDSEILSIIDVAERLCPINAVLESVVITSSGTVLALWQPLSEARLESTTDPADLRKDLHQALPRASKKQVVTDTVLLHATLARIATPKSTTSSNGEASQLKLPRKEELWAAVEAITREFCGTQARMDALWYVEEEDLLALALNGRIKKRTIPFQCKLQ